MTTCGEILDKLTILYKRIEVFKESKIYDNIADLKKQEAYLLESLAKTILEINSPPIVLFAKHFDRTFFKIQFFNFFSKWIITLK